MPSFLARRYFRRIESVSPTEKLLGILVLALVAGIVAVFVVQAYTDEASLFEMSEAAYQDDRPRGELAVAQRLTPSGSDPGGAAVGDAETPFPAPGVAGWRRPRRVDRFSADNLYVKINGRADAYLQFNVVGLTFGTYYHETDSERTADVYWYDMGKPVNAFGMYQSEAPSEAQSVPIGRQGYQTGGAVFFWQGSSYIQVLPAGETQSEAAAAMEIARRIGARIEDTADDLWAVAMLPESGRVAGSLAYLARDAFGLDFLEDVFTADYDAPAGRFTLFIHRAGDQAAAEALLAKYVDSFEQYGRVLWRDPDPSRRMVAGDVSGLIDVVFAKGVYLGGVAGADDADAAKQAATAFYEGLSVP